MTKNVMNIVEGVSDCSNLKKSRAGCYSRLKGRLKCSFLRTFNHFKKQKKCSKKTARNDPPNTCVKKSISSVHWFLKRKRHKVRSDCKTGLEPKLGNPREDSQQMKQALVKRVERKLEELKALYTDSWSVFKGVGEDIYDNVSCDAVSKILTLLSKVKNDIFHSQGNFEIENVDKLEEMAGNLDELNSELLSMRDSYLPCLSRTVSNQLPRVLEGSESLADNSDNDYTINRGDKDCCYSDKGSGLHKVSYHRDITTEESSKKWFNDKCSNYSKSFKALNCIATRLERNGANKDRVCLGKILGTIEKVHQELYVQMLKSFKAQVEDVTQDLTRIKSRLIHLDKSEEKTKDFKDCDGDSYSVKRKPKCTMVNGALDWESSVIIDSNGDDIEKKNIQTFITLFRQIKAFHKIVNKLDEIKRDYSALRKSPTTEGLKLYKRAEMMRLIQGLGYIKRKTQQMSLHFEGGDYQSTSGGKSFISLNCRCPINSEAGDFPMINPIHKCGDEEHQTKEFESMPWDRGTNSLYQTMMYHPNFNDMTFIEENMRFGRKDFNDINKKNSIVKSSETCCDFRFPSTHDCIHCQKENMNKISSVNLRPLSKQKGSEHFIAEQDASERSGSIISDLFVKRQTNQNNVASSNKKFNQLMNAGFRLLGSSLNKLGSEHSFKHRCDTKCIRNIASRPKSRQMNNYALSIQEDSFHSDIFNDTDNDSSTFKVETSNDRENDERITDHGLQNKFRKSTVVSDYSEVSVESNVDCLQDLSVWQKRNVFLKNDHSSPILRKSMKEKNSPYCRDIPELADGRELYFKIECFNRATSITGLRGKCITNKASQPAETWFKYSKLDSSVISFNHLAKKSIKVQTEKNLERKESNNEVYCVIHPCTETSDANSCFLKSKHIKRKLPLNKMGKHLPLPDSFWSNKQERCQSNISDLFGEKSESNKWLMNSKVLINSGPFK